MIMLQIGLKWQFRWSVIFGPYQGTLDNNNAVLVDLSSLHVLYFTTCFSKPALLYFCCYFSFENVDSFDHHSTFCFL